MRIGIPKEVLNNENRVAMAPSGVYSLTQAGHQVFIQKNAGEGSSFADEAYKEVGAVIVDTAEEAWKQDMVLKVKEPQEEEFKYFHEGLILFTYLHLANEPELTKALAEHKVTALAYETVQLPHGPLPLLTPMSEVAGRMVTQVGMQFLEKIKGGKGILLSGIPGVARGKVAIIGGGVVGTNAAKIAIGLGAKVTIIDLNPDRLRQLDDIFGNSITTLISNPHNIQEAVTEADLVVGSVLIPGAKAPVLVTERMVKQMTPGSVMVDVAIDQGGNFETSDRITTHDDPIFLKHGVVHYTVANMPGAVPQTATIGLTNATSPYVLQLANKGYKQAVLDNEALLKGVNTLGGYVTYKAVADTHEMEYKSVQDVLRN
ncbi:alanine dehydrogenase [Oceanobacillus alkalisoli]|uniref:alanine dehydrogenase n=1 Tax=Oceanobacillus alkalisoli TaxID=2925113 RepID=UPI001EF0FCB2|nr:alanine dehydrogenase [Oceanobacillus alkalisoli]MCF3943338.1 alanine dehydrogenase [Oceanobacillus alkalisoli]MCG5105279.1 alanine dehydrogenase [Oceanobacillus alkalisoli]